MDATCVTTERFGGTVVIRLRGSLLLDTAPFVRDELPDLDDLHPQLLVADLLGVTEIDSSGLALLLWMHRGQVNRGYRFIVVADNPMIHRAFNVTKLCDVLDVRRQMPEGTAS
jgi:anti-anti-sigma factor